MVCGWGDVVTGEHEDALRSPDGVGDKGLLDAGHWGGRQGPDQP